MNKTTIHTAAVRLIAPKTTYPGPRTACEPGHVDVAVGNVLRLRQQGEEKRFGSQESPVIPGDHWLTGHAAMPQDPISVLM